MIYVKIELWPIGRRSHARTLGEIIVHNTGGSHSSGDYQYLISKVGGFRATDEQISRAEVKNVLRTGEVRGFPRLRLYATDLLLRVLASAFCARNVTPEVTAAMRDPLPEAGIHGIRTACTDPDKMHGAADQFPGSDYP